MLDEDEESFGYDYEYYLLDGDNADKLGVMEDKDEAVEEDNYYYYSSTSRNLRSKSSKSECTRSSSSR